MSLLERLRSEIEGFHEVKVRDWSHLYFVLDRIERLLDAAEEPAVYGVPDLGLSREELEQFRKHSGSIVLDDTDERRDAIVDAAVAYVTVGSEPGLSDAEVAAESVKCHMRLVRAVEAWLDEDE